MPKWKEAVMNKNIISLLESAKDKLSPWAIEWATFDKNASEASSKIEESINELQKPTLDNYIQALPYLTFNGYDKETLEATDNDWAYAPTLYKGEGKWFVDWVEGVDHESFNVVEGSTPIEAARNAYNWCVGKGFIKDTLHD